MRKLQRPFGPKRVAIMALGRWPYSIGIDGQIPSVQLANFIGIRTKRFKSFQSQFHEHHPGGEHVFVNCTVLQSP